MQRTLDALDVGPVAIFGEFVHNELVYQELALRGARRVDDLRQIPMGQPVVIGPHGNTSEIKNGIEQSGGSLLDVSCPKVNRVIDAAVEFFEDGHTIVFVGKAGHEEARMIRSRIGMLYEVHSLEDIDRLPLDGTLAFVAQSTEMMERLTEFVAAARETGRTVVWGDTICSETKFRQSAVRELSQWVDLMIIVGGTGSYNTAALRSASERRCQAVVIENSSQVTSRMLCGVTKVGLTAGASTPDAAVQEVLEKLVTLGGHVNEDGAAS